MAKRVTLHELVQNKRTLASALERECLHELKLVQTGLDRGRLYASVEARIERYKKAIAAIEAAIDESRH